MAGVEWPELSLDEIATTVAPLLKGRPHMYGHMPMRFVTLVEAKHRGWKYFYIGDVCKKGHKAPRFVSNPSACVDCDRMRNGMQLIGGKGSIETHKPVRASRSDPAGERSVEPTKRQKDFLASYAELKDFDAAAKKVNLSPSVIESELAYNVVFRDAYDNLEERIGVYHMGAYDLDYEWDESKESMFIRMYVDTGLADTARDAIRVTNFEFEKHCRESPAFAGRVKEAEPLANRILVERARRAAIEGNPQMLIKIAGNLDLTEPEDPAAGMTDEQLDDEIIRTLGLAKREANARASADAESSAKVPAGADDPENVSEAVPESFDDIL